MDGKKPIYEFPEQGNFRRYLPSSFDNSIDIYETLVNMREYLNEVIRVTNYTSTEVEKFIKDIDAKIQKYSKEEVDRLAQTGYFDDIINTRLFKVVNDELRRLDEVKADKKDVKILEDKVNSSTSIGFNGVFEWLADLNEKYPNGAEGVYYVRADNKWYFWDKTNKMWTMGGTFFDTVYNSSANVKLSGVDGRAITQYGTEKTFSNINGVITYDKPDAIGNYSGFQMPVTADFVKKSSKGMYFSFLGLFNSDKMSLYLWDNDAGKSIYEMPITLEPKVSKMYYITWNEEVMKGILSRLKTNNIRFLVTHANPYLENRIQDMVVSSNPYRTTLDDYLTDQYYKGIMDVPKTINTIKVDESKWRVWNSLKTSFKNENGVLTIKGDNVGYYSGCEIDLDADMLKKANELYITARVKKMTGKIAFGISLWNSSQIYQDARQVSIQGDRVIFHIPRSTIVPYVAGLKGKPSLIFSFKQPYDIEISDVYISDIAPHNNLNDFLVATNYNVGTFDEWDISKEMDYTDGSFTKNTIGDIHYACLNKVFNHETYVDYFYFFATENYTLNYMTANIDQYKLLLPIEKRTANLVRGWNLIYSGIKVPAQAYLCFDMNKEQGVYKNLLPSDILHQDDSHTIDQNGYSGMIMQPSDQWIPVYYKQRQTRNSERMRDYDQRIKTLETSKPTESAPIVISPNGKRFEIVVDNGGKLGAKPVVPDKTVILGNSLSLGFGEFGMCASDNTKDYTAHLLRAMKRQNPNATIQRVISSAFESKETTAERKQWVENVMPKFTNPELFIIQLGDNVNTPQKQATFQNDAIWLINYLKGLYPNAKIVWTGLWYNVGVIKPMLINVTRATNTQFIDFSELGNSGENKGYIGQVITKPDGSTLTVDNNGIASHPGDLGMERIGKIIQTALGI